MGQCFSYHGSGGQRYSQGRSQRSSLSLKQNQVYHLNHIECLPYQGRRSRYSTQSSSFLGLVTRQNSAGHSIPSTRQSSVAGSHPVLPQEHPYSTPGVSNPVLHRDSLLAGSSPILARQHYRNSGGASLDELAARNNNHHHNHHQHRQSLLELHPDHEGGGGSGGGGGGGGGLSYDDFRRGGGNRMFRSYLDYQAARQSYLLAVSQDNLLDTGTPPPPRPQSRQEQLFLQAESTHSLSMEVFLSSPVTHSDMYIKLFLCLFTCHGGTLIGFFEFIALLSPFLSFLPLSLSPSRFLLPSLSSSLFCPSLPALQILLTTHLITAPRPVLMLRLSLGNQT